MRGEEEVLAYEARMRSAEPRQDDDATDIINKHPFTSLHFTLCSADNIGSL